MTYTTVETNAVTGVTAVRQWTPEEISAREARLASMVRAPKSITPRQCRLLLLQQGLLASVEATIAQSTEDVRISWEYATEFRRDDPIFLIFATALGFSDTAIDQFLIAAAQL